MKCRSVACIWSGTPFPHRVTAVAAFPEPPSPSFYSAGSDGSIVWWTLSPSTPPQVNAVGVLCGHAAPITDLAICTPVASEDRNGSVSKFGALISACCDGFLCVWSRKSGHCRCRRKLPPWVGTPRFIRTLISTPRYVCIACSFLEGNEGVVGAETHPRKPPKCTVLIVDTYSLSITQTVFHGNLSVGPVKFMALMLGDDEKRNSVFVADSAGRQQMVSMSEEPLDSGDDNASLRRDKALLESGFCSDEGLSGVEQVVSVLTCGNLVAFILKDRCMFRLLSSDSTIGEVSFKDSLFCLDWDSTQTHAAGGIFLEGGDGVNLCNTDECGDLIPVHLVVWNNVGYAIVYKISYQTNVFQCEPHCEIPATHYQPDMRLSIFFLQVNRYLVCIKSISFHYEDPLLWRPLVTIWSLDHFDGSCGKLYRQCRMISDGVSFTNWFEKPAQLKALDDLKSASAFGDSSRSNGVDDVHVDSSSNCYAYKGKVVSSSMIISENLFTPYGIVYGFLSGEIEFVRFDLFQGICLDGASSNSDEKSTTCKQYFLGHTGAVLCLAAHQMMGSAQSCTFKRVLVSGSMDCTIRIWDLDTGSIIMVMHHHVAAVRQIILPPSLTGHPWSDCFLTVGEDACVALVSLQTLRVERIFPGHMHYPSKVVWDGARGYVACLCQMHCGTSDATDVLYIWDMKTGARERVLRGTAGHSMFEHFCKNISTNSISGALLNGNTSVSSLLLPVVDDTRFPNSSISLSENSLTSSRSSPNMTELNSLKANAGKGNSAKPSSSPPIGLLSNKLKLPVKCSCPFPGIVSLSFDLASLMFSYPKNESIENGGRKLANINLQQQGVQEKNPSYNNPEALEGRDRISLFEEYLLRYSLSFLHLWGVDTELDNLLISDMKLRRPENFVVASGLQGDKGSLTLTFPGQSATLELWKSSSEFCAMRSLTMVSLAQRLISLSHPGSAASSALAAFYTRNFVENFPDVKPPSLQLLVAFWQDESEHVRMAARSIFHCAASHAIPLPLCNSKPTEATNNMSSKTGSRDEHLGNMSVESIIPKAEKQEISQDEESKILAWLESFEVQDWISCVGGTSQDAMTSHIIVAAALAIWYPSLVKPSLATLVVHPLMKLAMAMNEKYSSTAAELLAEGMDSTWKECIVSEIPRLIGDIFFQVELSGPSSKSATELSDAAFSIKKTLVEVLLPSLAMADIPGFLTVIESQIWSTASDSPVHLVSLLTLIRIMRGSPKNLAQYLDKVVNFILQTIDPSNSVMRKACFHSSMTTFREVVRVYPMVAVNDSWTRLAVGDVVGEINNASIRVYDMQSVSMIKVLDASGPPGLPTLLTAATTGTLTTAISALSFSPDGEGLVAFSENGLLIRWWSLGSFWWEKLSRNFVPVQCTKLIFVPPWEGFSPNSSRSSIMASILETDRQLDSQNNGKDSNHGDSLKQLLHNLDLSYRLEWVDGRKVLLTRHGHELGTFQL